jgi:hypothetical protein
MNEKSIYLYIYNDCVITQVYRKKDFTQKVAHVSRIDFDNLINQASQWLYDNLNLYTNQIRHFQTTTFLKYGLHNVKYPLQSRYNQFIYILLFFVKNKYHKRFLTLPTD